MELQKIYILSYYHGSGAGQALLDAVIDLASKVQPDFLWLDTHIQNEKAIHFYERNGFRRGGKYLFTIGTQTFEYYLMCLPVAVMEPC
jgi:ribosomal protein S18 acetylase RimI-like enzyme